MNAVLACVCDLDGGRFGKINDIHHTLGHSFRSSGLSTPIGTCYEGRTERVHTELQFDISGSGNVV